jgi:hypothetical protein
MKFRFGEFADDHQFFRARALIDWTFKLFAWIGVVAALQVAAETTRSAFVYAAWILAYLLVLVFLQAFLDWLFTFKRPSKLGSMGVIAQRAGGKKWRSGIVWVIATAFWLAIGVGMQNAVSYAVGTIVAFQKNHGNPSDRNSHHRQMLRSSDRRSSLIVRMPT